MGCVSTISMSVRSAVPADAMEVARVHVHSWQVAYRGLLPDAFLDGLRAEDRAGHYTFALPGEEPATIVALEAGVIRGFATIGSARGEHARGVGELLAIYIDPGHWGRGIGRALMAGARGRLREQGFAEAILWVLVGNERAERFYRGDGWAPDGAQGEERLGGRRTEEIRYRRALA
jgi:GNAT superfamily N-acetyltransferase